MTIKTLSIVACLLLAAGSVATARSLTPKEKAYVEALRHFVVLRVRSSEGLASRSGAAGVRIRFEGLTVVRLNFPTQAAAEAYALRLRRAEKKGTRRLEVHGKEVVLLGGSRLKDATLVSYFLAGAWAASLDAPSVTTERPPPVIVTASGQRIQLRRARPRPRPKPAPNSANLAATYLTHGVGRIVIDQIKNRLDGVLCRVRFRHFRTEGKREFPAVFDGRFLIVQLPQRVEGEGPEADEVRDRVKHGLVREACFEWRPTQAGTANFRLVGFRDPLVPEAARQFWHPSAE
ncbi:MAG: hypothetical protein JKY65_03180 [Planctomycetes bacterium]|nr:hypothetical protein [Planctomycetota bacterium]